MLPGSARERTAEDASLSKLGPRRKDPIDRLAHRDLAPTAGLRPLEPEDTAREVDTFPRQPHELSLPQPGLEGHRHDVMQVTVLGPGAGLEQACLLLELKPPHPALRLTFERNNGQSRQDFPLAVSHS